MKKVVNGKEIKITKAGYLYINGVKQTTLRVSPLQIPTDDADAIEVCHQSNRKNWRMVNSLTF